ncbi:MAG: prepilin-type N-terminal cleavage/methylation domain-containing protein [candidate division Zixibacteria bacterium]|nr:prepilin-type N-terminal cleavage/methylation domain-containing protein [candidate division Zixibacteria bacterium]
MKNILSKLKLQHGVTLVEILVAATITAIITAAAAEVYITQHQSYIWQEQITEMNMNANAAMEELVKRISEAGKGIPTDIGGGIPYLFSYDTNPDTIRIVSRDLGDSGYFGYEALTGTPTVFHCWAADDTGGLHTYERGIHFMDIEAGDSGLVADYANNYCTTFAVTYIDHNYATGISHTPTRIVVSGSYVTKIEYYKLFLDVDSTFGGECHYKDTTINGFPVKVLVCSDTTVSGNLVMMTVSDPGTEIVASNIVDLQFKYFMTNGDSLDTASPNIPVDRVRITLTARTEKRVQGNQYRYKTLTEVVKIKGGRSYRDMQ